MPKIELFLQFEGNRKIVLIEIDSEALVSEIIAAAIPAGLSGDEHHKFHVFNHEHDEPLAHDKSLKHHGLGHRHRIHIHRCHRIETTLQFNEVREVMHFPPSATIERVKKAFVKSIKMSPVDATEHVLQLCGTTDRPEPDTQIGALASGCCTVCFNLVPIKRIEG